MIKIPFLGQPSSRAMRQRVSPLRGFTIVFDLSGVVSSKLPHGGDVSVSFAFSSTMTPKPTRAFGKAENPSHGHRKLLS
jgi:hypothetical protein